MIRNNNFYKSSDFLKEDFREIMNSYFNPFEYNLECNLNYESNSDKMALRSKSHLDRQKMKNNVK